MAGGRDADSNVPGERLKIGPLPAVLGRVSNTSELALCQLGDAVPARLCFARISFADVLKRSP